MVKTSTKTAAAGTVKPTPTSGREPDPGFSARSPANSADSHFSVVHPASDLRTQPLPQSGSSRLLTVQKHEMTGQLGNVNASWPEALLPQQLAALADAPYSLEGIRYDERRRPYIDLLEGTFLARKDGRYGYRISTPSMTYGIPVERIPGTNRWQKKPGFMIDVEWLGWGSYTKPPRDDAIEIADLYYAIVPQALNSSTTHVYLKHPDFVPGSYEAFEHMLRSAPNRQPRLAERSHGDWKISQTLQYQQTLVEKVASCFPYMSDKTLTQLARAAFNWANELVPTVTGEGLWRLNETLHAWATRTVPRSVPPRLADPLMLLPELASRLYVNLSGRTISLPSPRSPEFLRIDFDIHKLEKGLYGLNGPEFSLRNIFADILEDYGYHVDRDNRMLSEDALLFQRSNMDTVFVLRLPVHDESVSLERPFELTPQLRDPVFRAKIAKSRWMHMLTPGMTVHLAGGKQQVSPDSFTLFIVREG
jgi:hypothetical protein